MKHFKKEEFREWYSKMDTAFLERLDLLRDITGTPIMISPHPDALGRTNGSTTSRHYYDGNKPLACADLMPKFTDEASIVLFLYIAKSLDFTGIGFYPLWSPGPGIHLDMRDGELATWGAIPKNGMQKYYSIEYVLDYWRKHEEISN